MSTYTPKTDWERFALTLGEAIGRGLARNLALGNLLPNAAPASDSRGRPGRKAKGRPKAAGRRKTRSPGRTAVKASRPRGRPRGRGARKIEPSAVVRFTGKRGSEVTASVIAVEEDPPCLVLFDLESKQVVRVDPKEVRVVEQANKISTRIGAVPQVEARKPTVRRKRVVPVPRAAEASAEVSGAEPLIEEVAASQEESDSGSEETLALTPGPSPILGEGGEGDSSAGAS